MDAADRDQYRTGPNDALTFDAGDTIANEDGVPITPFVQIAAVMTRNPLEDISIELAKLVKAVSESEANKPSGTVTLTLHVARSIQTMGAVVITPDIKTKLPKEPKYGTLLFTDVDGVLSTRNPGQKDIFDRPTGVK
jgi:hypothetical protein